MKEEHKVDQLFKAGLSEPEIPFDEKHWEAMAEKLDAGQKKNTIPMWLIAAASLAAMVIMGLFLLFSGSTEEHGKQKEKSMGLARIPEPSTPAAETRRPKVVVPVEKAAEISRSATVAATRKIEYIPFELKEEQVSFHEDTVRQPVLPMLAGIRSIEPQLSINSDPIIDSPLGRIVDVMVDQPKHWAFSILVAPDRSTTSSSVPSGLSSNVGLLASYSLSRKLSITSGLIYAKKLYNYKGLTTGTYGKSPLEVDADCRVLDVPLNLNYQLLRRRNFSLTVQSGLSSYFMLYERYKYIDGQPGGPQEVSILQVKNQNQHLFGVANFSISFEQKISRQFSIGVQPFYKLPLTGIGVHDANLQSKGVSFSVSVRPF